MKDAELRDYVYSQIISDHPSIEKLRLIMTKFHQYNRELAGATKSRTSQVTKESHTKSIGDN